MLQYEQQSQSIREELLKAQQAVLSRQIENTEAVTDRLVREVNRRLAGTAERVRAVADDLPPDLLRRSPTTQALAGEVEVLAGELEKAVADTRQAGVVEDEVRSGLERLVAEFASIREQLQLGGGGRAMVQILFSLDRRCIAAGEDLRKIPLPALDQTRLAALRARERLQVQPDAEMPIPARLQELLDARREVLEELDRQYAALVRTLALLEQNKQQYLDQARTIRAYIAEQLFGFGLRACPPITLDTLLGIPQALIWVFQVEHWRELAGGLRWIAVNMPLSTFGVLLLAALLLFSRSQMNSALENTGARLRRISTDRYGHTGEALLWTLLLAIPIPLVVFYAGWALVRLPALSDWMWGLTSGLERGAWILFAAAFFSSVMRRGGLGAAHFGWRQETLDRLRTTISRFVVVYVPTFLLTLSCVYGEASKHFESLGRVSFIMAHLWMTFLVFRLLYTRHGMPVAEGDGEPPRFLARSRRAWSVLLVAALSALVVLMALGYLITAIMLSLGLLTTLSLIGGGGILYGLALRGLSMRQRKLALAEAIERRRARRDAAASDDASTRSTEMVEVAQEEDNELDLDVVAVQTRDLLRAMFGIATLMAVLVYWSHTFPVVRLAGAVKLPLTGGLTVLQLAAVVLILIVAFTVVRNLPGLLELAVLRATDTAPGTRHAIVTLFQYGVIALGAALVLDVVQVDWAKFGWIAAALSVGLGFGLQEVVANFVCGLILLFERPIRVGDVVTVEGMTGTVTRIQMRATTITNWDRQEFVVPNKT